MEALLTAAGLCQSIIDCVQRVKTLKPQCKAVRGQVETLLPLLEKYADELRGNASGFADHDARWVTNLVVALARASRGLFLGARARARARMYAYAPPLSRKKDF